MTATHQRRAQWPTVLVLGSTGAGKTSLLQAIFGVDVVSEDRVGHGEPATRGFVCYERDGLKIHDSEGLEPAGDAAHRAKIDGFVSGLALTREVDEHVHVAWYAISGPGARVTDADLRTIRELPCPVLVLMTKSDITRPKQLADLMAAIRSAGVPEADILPCSIGDQASIEALLARTTSLFTTSHQAVLKAAAARRRKAREEALAVVEESARRAAATALIPFAGLVLSANIERKMVERIARCFGQSGSGDRYWKRLGRSAGDLDWASLAGAVLPGLRAVGAYTGYRRVKATGNSAIAYFAGGGRLKDTDLIAMASRQMDDGA
jgi:hypothetical protein